MEKHYRMCQSCGMPLTKDPNDGGTNEDGSKSGKYCSYCYGDGRFLQECTARQMQAFCKNMMVEKMKMPKFLASFMTMNIPRLERWMDQQVTK